MRPRIRRRARGCGAVALMLATAAALGGFGGLPAAGQSNPWSPGKAMEQARFEHTATMLDRADCHEDPPTTSYPCGKVLVVGGHGSETSLSSVEIYDPMEKDWTWGSPLPEIPDPADPNIKVPTPRNAHTATLMLDGKVLVVGGQGSGGGGLPTAILYDPAHDWWSGPWERPRPVPSLQADWEQHAAVLLDRPDCHATPPTTEYPCGAVLVSGGLNRFGANTTGTEYQQAELFRRSGSSLVLERTGDMVLQRKEHTLTLIGGDPCHDEPMPPYCGMVLAAGGYVMGSASLTASAELYDPVREVWTPARSMQRGRVEHDAVSLISGKVLVVGGSQSGNTSEEFDALTNTWGCGGESKNPECVTMWGQPEMRGRFLTGLPDGRVLMAGGSNDNDVEPAFVYDPANPEWSDEGTVSPSRSHARFASLPCGAPGGRRVLTGGLDRNSSPLDNLSIYTPLFPEILGADVKKGPRAGGTIVKIRGRNFPGGTPRVLFGASQAGFQSSNPGEITVTTPPYSRGPAAPGAGPQDEDEVTVPVRVRWGQRAADPCVNLRFTYEAKSADPLPGVELPKIPVVPAVDVLPAVVAIDPRSGPVEGGTRVQVTGSAFGGADAVFFGDRAVTHQPCGTAVTECFTVEGPGQITVFSPPVPSPRHVHVTVRTAAGRSAETPADLFQYVETPAVHEPDPQPGPASPSPGGFTPATPGGAPGTLPATSTAPGFSPAPGGAPGLSGAAVQAPAGASAPVSAPAPSVLPGASTGQSAAASMTGEAAAPPGASPVAGASVAPQGFFVPGSSPVALPGFGGAPQEAEAARPAAGGTGNHPMSRRDGDPVPVAFMLGALCFVPFIVRARPARPGAGCRAAPAWGRVR